MKIINIKPKSRKKGFYNSNFLYSKNDEKLSNEISNEINFLERNLEKYLNQKEKEQNFSIKDYNIAINSSKILINRS